MGMEERWESFFRRGNNPYCKPPVDTVGSESGEEALARHLALMRKIDEEEADASREWVEEPTEETIPRIRRAVGDKIDASVGDIRAPKHRVLCEKYNV